MARKNRSNHRVEQGLPKLRGFAQQVEVVPDPTKQPPTPSPRVAPQSPAVDAVDTPGAVPRNKRTWPLTPPPPPSGGKQPPLHPASGRATHTDANGAGNVGRREKQQHSGEADPKQCYWSNATCTAAPTPGKRFCPEHFREDREQRRGWSD